MKKKPWPTKDAMQQVYEMNLWGSNSSKFYSGEGTHNPNIVNPYLEAVNQFLTSFKKPISVLDLGCGDFNIGQNFVQYSKKYTAVDIVEDLINHNKNTYKADNLEFKCLDISKDNLPKADCIILRQVLQHLSNNEVQNVVKKLINYKYVILTEHIPLGNFEPNKDIISGQGIRLKKQSGIDLLASPFHLKVKEQKQLLSFNLENNKGVITTSLFTMF